MRDCTNRSVKAFDHKRQKVESRAVHVLYNLVSGMDTIKGDQAYLEKTRYGTNPAGKSGSNLKMFDKVERFHHEFQQDSSEVLNFLDNSSAT